MRKSRFTEAQIIGMIKEQEAGMPTVEVCRKHGVNRHPILTPQAVQLIGLESVVPMDHRPTMH